MVANLQISLPVRPGDVRHESDTGNTIAALAGVSRRRRRYRECRES
jgi:hypothetical protein